MLINPYPKEIPDEASGISVLDERHKIWQAGYVARGKEDRDIVSNINWETDDLETFERMILSAFGLLPREENKRR